MTPVAECTVPEKILIAALHLEEQGESPFSAESLIVAAWRKFPNAFGLKGYEDQHPDSNKVLSSIMGERGLTRRGWLTKVGQKLYTLSAEGRRVVQRLKQGEEAPVLESSKKLSRDQERLLTHLLNSGAVQKYQENRKEELTFGEACKFWGVNEEDQGQALDTRLQKVRLSLEAIERILGPSSELVLSNGRCVTADELEALNKVHDNMEARFARHLNLLRTRAAK
jgi:hypothetical protein